MRIGFGVRRFVIAFFLFTLCGPLVIEATAQEPALSADQAVIDQGKEIFDGNCATCHAVDKKVVGPALKNVYERRKVSWLLGFIKYPQKVIDSGDEYAQALYVEYKQYMPNHDFFSDAEIISILSYVKHETENPTTAAAPTGTVSVSETGATVEEGVSAALLQWIIIGLIVILVILLFVMVLLISLLVKHLKGQDDLSDEEKEYVSQKFRVGAVLKSPAFIGILSFVFVLFVLRAVVAGLFSVGVQQGYAPEQPIKFSHKLHAGYYEIDCQYCHNGVTKSKNANIPSANVCMTCHNTIRNTSPEIQKIYKAIENDEPIQWVRIHNLPDLAYFNHSQHVNVAGLDCENCHGNIEEMEVVQQYSLLTMGWCIDCHRKTDVNSKGNAYYDRLVSLHDSKSTKPMKVEDIGGLECAKCHY